MIALGPTVSAARLLRNDSLEAGGEVAFYPALRVNESFDTYFDVPDDLPDYLICRLFAFIGPDDFNVFTVRLQDVTPEGELGDIIWDTGLGAFQLAGSRNSLNSIDLADERIEASARRIRVRFTHAEGFPGPPTIAADTDGITPSRNQLMVQMRNGDWRLTWTEDIGDDDPTIIRPSGDWIVRVEVAEAEVGCGLDPVAPVSDAGASPADAAPQPPARDARSDERDTDAPAARDANTGGDRDAGVMDPVGRDARVRSVDRFVVERVVPSAGEPNTNVEVVIVGEGFPVGESPRVRLEPVGERLLDVAVRSSSTITAIVPAGLLPGTYNLHVERDDGQLAILPEAYTVVGIGELSLTGIEPRHVVEGERPHVTISGLGFAPGTEFRIGGAPLSDLAVVDSHTARARLEIPLAPGTYDVEAQRGDEVVRLPAAFAVQRAAGRSVEGCAAVPGRPVGWIAALVLVGLLRRRRR